MSETDDGTALPGSVAAATRLLAELAELAGQQTADAPVLELMVEGITTFTSVSDEQASLLVMARLPVCEKFGYLLAGKALQNKFASDRVECRWHAGQGCYVAVRSVPLAALPDERSIMDAILDMANAAAVWHAALAAGKNGMPS
jgi:hypothetical protein